MKRFIPIALMAAMLGLPVVGCNNKDNDDDDGATLKVDTEGENKSIKVDDND